MADRILEKEKYHLCPLRVVYQKRTLLGGKEKATTKAEPLTVASGKDPFPEGCPGSTPAARKSYMIPSCGDTFSMPIFLPLIVKIRQN
jgi:hypothetical protein